MNLTPFSFNGADIRVITDDLGEPWFVAKDVADLLEYADTDQAVRSHCRAAKTCPVKLTGQVRRMKVIPERDVYRLVMRSTMPAAEQFEEWVVGEVLPSIRRTGSYSRPMTQAELIAASANVLVNIERRQAEQQALLVQAEGRLDAHERLLKDMSHSQVWDHCPQNCLSLTGIKAVMNERYGLSASVVDFVLKSWPHQPNPAGMVRNGHEDAKGSQYLVWSKTMATAAFRRFVDECVMVTATQATHPYLEGRFKLARKSHP